MNLTSFRRAAERSIVACLSVACGGQTAASSARDPGGSGGTSAVTVTSTHAGSTATYTSNSATGGATTSATASSTSSSVALGGASTTIASGGAVAGASMSTNTGGFAALGGSSGTLTPNAGASASESSGGTTNAVTTNLSLPSELPGTWLIGWTGGLEHYSWIRCLAYDVSLGGRVEILNVEGNVAVWTSYLGCEGRGTWYLTAMPNTIELRLPVGCSQDARVEVIFVSFRAGPGVGMFTKAIGVANVQVTGLSPSGGNPINAFRYPDSQCDAAMTSCQLPT
jgi:hypothetical protein